MSVCRHVSNLFNMSAIVRRAASQSSLVLNHNSNCRTFTTTSCCGLKKGESNAVSLGITLISPAENAGRTPGISLTRG